MKATTKTYDTTTTTTDPSFMMNDDLHNISANSHHPMVRMMTTKRKQSNLPIINNKKQQQSHQQDQEHAYYATPKQSQQQEDVRKPQHHLDHPRQDDNNNNRNSPRIDPIYMYSSLLAGIGSGTVSGIVCSPLDLIKTRMQVWGSVVGTSATTTTPPIGLGGLRTISLMFQDILRTDGIQGCFRGLTATLLTIPAFWGCYFPLYEEFKRYGMQYYHTTEPAFIHMGSAVMAGAISDVLCNPMFVVRTRLQTEAVHNMMKQQQLLLSPLSSKDIVITKLSMIQTIKSLYQEGGILTFWRGMTANLLGLSHVAIQFPAYEYLKKTLRQRWYHHEIHHKSSLIGFDPNHHHDKAVDLLIASALSKMVACVVTYPHEVVRSRMMDARISSSPISRLGFIATCQKIYQTESIWGFYTGLPLSLIRTTTIILSSEINDPTDNGVENEFYEYYQESSGPNRKVYQDRDTMSSRRKNYR